MSSLAHSIIRRADHWAYKLGLSNTVSTDPASLQEALQQLKDVIAAGANPAAAFESCLSVQSPDRGAHTLYQEIGEIALSAEQWVVAERCAMLALQALPRFGAAFKLLGLSLRARERFDDAALCHRYNLPYSIREKYFKNSSVDALDSLQASDTVTRLHAFDAEYIDLTPPRQLKPGIIEELSEKTLHVREARTYQLSSCRIWFDSFNTVVWDSKGRIITDACRGFYELVQNAVSKQTQVELDGLSCVLGNRNSDNYYHWMNDVLPRLAVLQASGIEWEKVDHFICNKLKHAFQFETLAAFGIDASRIRQIGNNIYFKCHECVVPVYGSNTLGLGQGAWNPAFLKQHLLSESQSPQKQDKKLYISRADSSTRGITNEQSLIAYLNGIGFDCVQMENLSVREQADLFNSSSVILSPHGAGLSNIAFCKPGSTIIELYKDHIAPCFWTISEVTGLRHCVHYCGSDQASTEAADGEGYHISADKRRKSNFSVDLDEIAALLASLKITPG
ncbi:MAG: DUF563 domain-containing protein [Granulosicoccus sp.]